MSKSERTSTPAIYIAANDLLVYASAISQPTGIQRVASGLAEALTERHGAQTVVLTSDSARLVELPTLDRPARGARSPFGLFREPALRLLARAPRRLQELVRRLARAALAKSAASRGGLPVALNPGDVILVLGAPWIAPGMASAAIALRESYGVNLGLLVHDLLPVTSPTWFADAQGRAAKTDVEALIAHASALFAVSREVAAELSLRYQKRATVIKLAEPPLSMLHQPRTRGLYELYVGTLHPRKNLEALVQIWSRWADAPKLIIAGRRHPQDGSLFRALAASPAASARIELRHDVDDAELGRLYANARFLVLPSLAEGWGLPVREAFAAGRPAIATDAVPAAVDSPFAAIVPSGDTDTLERTIHEWWDSDLPEALASRIATEFRPRTWGDAAAELVADLVRPAN